MRLGQPPGNPRLTALWTTDPKAAAAQVSAALASSKTKAEAAKKLGVGLRTIWQWLSRPELRGL
jgi:transcriptional regulator with PAS, ATPase and Fis domain